MPEMDLAFPETWAFQETEIRWPLILRFTLTKFTKDLIIGLKVRQQRMCKHYRIP